MEEGRHTETETTSGVHFPPPLLYAGGFLAGYLLKRTVPLPAPPRALSLGLAVALLIPGFGLIYWALGLFFRRKTSPLPFRPTTALVTTGPYRWSRNPMYLGMLLVYLGLSFWSGVLWAVVLAPIVAALVGRLVIRKEETYLEGRFGESYQQYTRQVGRWLGRKGRTVS